MPFTPEEIAANRAAFNTLAGLVVPPEPQLSAQQEKWAAEALTKPSQAQRQRKAPVPPTPLQTLQEATQRKLDAINYNAANPNPKASRGKRYRNVADSIAAERASKATYEATPRAKVAKANWKADNPDKVRESKRKWAAKDRAKKRTTPARKYHRADTTVREIG